MTNIQNLLLGALKNSGHAVAILDRELKIRWEGGLPRAMIGAPVSILWQGAKVARREMGKVMECLVAGMGCQTEVESQRGGGRWRIDFIPLRDPAGELKGFAAVRQMVNSATENFSEGVAEIYELLFEIGGFEDLVPLAR